MIFSALLYALVILISLILVHFGFKSKIAKFKSTSRIIKVTIFFSSLV